MTDSCAEINAAIARLEAKINAIPRVDEQSIIQKAIAGAKTLLTPEIGAAAAVGFVAQQKAVEALKVSSQGVSLATSAQTAAAGAQSTAASAGSLAANALGKVLGLIGIVAGLAAAIGVFYVLSARIDAVEGYISKVATNVNRAFDDIGKVNRRVDGVDSSLKVQGQKLVSLDGRVSVHDAIIKDIQALLNFTQKAVEKLIGIVGQINKKLSKTFDLAITANQTAIKALATGTAAQRSADKANETAGKADAIAKKADGKADKIAAELPSMKRETARAHELIQETREAVIKVIQQVKQDVYILAQGLISLRETVAKTVKEYFSLHHQQDNEIKTVSRVANEALREASELRPPINRATVKADQAQNRANQVSTQISPLRLLSERAYSDALKAYNKVETDVPPVISGIEQVRRAGASIEQQFRNSANNVQDQFKTINSTIQNRLSVPATTIQQQSTIIQQQIKQQLQNTTTPTALTPAQLEPIIANSPTIKKLQLPKTPVDSTKILTPSQLEPLIISSPTITNLKTTIKEQEKVNEKGLDEIGKIGLGLVAATTILNRVNLNTSFNTISNAAAAGTCRTTLPGGCMSNLANNAANNASDNLFNKLKGQLGSIATGANTALLAPILANTNTLITRVGAPIAGGLSGGIGRMSSFLGIDRALSILTFLSTVHNASMLTSSLKVTLLETLSSVGNATGLLQTSEGDNVDLNKVFNNGIEAFITSLIGTEAYASMKLTWRKYSSIYRAGSNVLSNVGNMFSSIGNGIEEIGERSGKIGNALMAAGAIRENAFPKMSESMTVHTNKFMTFQTKIGGVTEFVESINEVAESVIEGQEGFTEATKAATEFKKQLAVAEKNPLAGSDAIQAEAEKIKANLVKDPTGEDEQGLLSFLTDL